MKKKLNAIITRGVLIIFLSSVSTILYAGDRYNTEHLLDSLDDIMYQRQEILNKKQSVINDLKRGIVDISSPEALAVKYQQIFQEYLHFNADSAIVYAKRAEKVSLLANRPELTLTSRFNLLMAYTRQGSMGKAFETILKIGRLDDVLPAYRERYAVLLLDFYMRVDYKEETDYVPNIDFKEAWKRYSPYLANPSMEYDFFQAICTGKADIKRIEKEITAHPQPSYQAANLHYALSFIYRQDGDMDKYYYHLISSSINDMLLANTEVSSLLNLLQTPLLKKDLRRSYEYVQVCADNVKQYNDKQRALRLVEIQERINNQFNESRTRQMTIIIVVAGLFFVALVMSILETRMVASRGKKAKRSLDALRILHSKQAELVKQQQKLSDELKEANSRLSDRVATYRKDFLNVYHLVSTYITYEKKARIDIENMLKSNNVRKAIREISSTSDIDGQLKHFYEHFDHAFLAMYPDFIHRMNTLVKDECKFDETQTGLTTSLRIYALMVLGVTDSVGIADFLHLSSQTVYNYRLRMRRCAAGDEKKFDDDVLRLY